MRADKAIARGRTAEIYPWQDGHVIKLYYDWFPAAAVEYEARLAAAVSGAGLPVPAVGKLLEVDGRLGLVYERIEGPSMFDLLGRRPWTLFRLAPLLAELQAQTHDIVAPAGLPPQKERLAQKIRQAKGLTGQVQAARLEDLAGMPAGNTLCHGDFHPGNVIIGKQGPVIIDWMDAAAGHPLADVARSSLLALGEAAVTRNRLTAMFIRRFHRIYLAHYFKLRPGDENLFRAWLPVIAAARLNEGITELQEWLVEQAAS